MLILKNELLQISNLFNSQTQCISLTSLCLTNLVPTYPPNNMKSTFAGSRNQEVIRETWSSENPNLEGTRKPEKSRGSFIFSGISGSNGEGEIGKFDTGNTLGSVTNRNEGKSLVVDVARVNGSSSLVNGAVARANGVVRRQRRLSPRKFRMKEVLRSLDVALLGTLVRSSCRI